MNNKFFNVPQVNNNQNDNGSNGDETKIIIAITVIVVIIIGILIVFMVSDSKKKEDTEKNKKEQKVVDTIPERKEDEEEETPEEEPVEIVEEKNEYILECSEEDEYYSMINTFTFNKEKDSVTKVRFSYKVNEYESDTENYSEEYKETKEGARNLESMIKYYLFDQEVAGVSIIEYKVENNTIYLDMEFDKEAIEDINITNAIFNPISDYDMAMMNSLVVNTDICKIK